MKSILDDIECDFITESGCWIPKKVASGNGYIYIFRNGKSYSLNRLVMEEKLKRPLIKNEVIRHSCNIKVCANPSHLKTGTQRENIIDQHLTGAKSRLSVNICDVREVLDLMKYKIYPVITISKIYNISQPILYKIKNGTHWSLDYLDIPS